MNKVILGIIVVLAIIVVGWFFYTEQGIAPTAMDTPGVQAINTETEEISASDDMSLVGDMVEDIIVVYTSEGFEPKSVTINQGQTVRFVNESGRGMWVGSDNHPTHTNYPAKSESDCLGSSFDTCRGVAPGESWSFTFDEVGSWGYHNHTQAGHRGTVVVE